MPTTAPFREERGRVCERAAAHSSNERTVEEARIGS